MTDDEILYGPRKSPEVMRLLDRMALEVNTKIRQRGIARGFVCVQEAFNEKILHCEMLVYKASKETNDPRRRSRYISDTIMELQEISVIIRFMLKNKALTIGEVGVISKYKKDITSQLYRWLKSADSED